MPDSGKKTFLTRRDRWGHGMAVWIIAVVVLALPLIFWSLGQVDMHNDVAGWLPQDDPQAKILAWYRSSFPTEDRILVSWDDCSISDPRLKGIQDNLEGRFNEESDQREGGSPYVKSVSLPSGLIRRMLDRGVPFETAMDQVRGLLCGPGPLRVRLTDAGRNRGDSMAVEVLSVVNQVLDEEARLLDAMLEAPNSDGIPLEDESAWRYSDELTAWIRDRPAFDLSLSWPDMHADDESRQQAVDKLRQLTTSSGSGADVPCVEDVFFIDGSQAALTITLSEAGVAEHEAALAAVRAACLEAGVSEDNLRLGGRPVVSAELDHAVGRAGWNTAYEAWNLPFRSPILCSTLISIILALWMLKSVRLAILVQLTAVLVVLASVSIVPVTGGSMNMVLVVMPTLLAVLTTSAAIHLCNYWKHSSDQDEEGSVIEAVSTAWLPCFLASTTTAIGLGSLLVSNLVPVKDFGVYSAIGCILSFLMVLYFLPSLMLYWRRKPPAADELDTSFWRRLGQLLTRVRYPAVAACVIGSIICGYGLQKFRTETKVIRYFPEESRLFQDYVYLEDNLSGIISVDTIVRFNTTAQEQMTFLQRAQTVMKLQQKIREHDEISGTLSLASFLDVRDGRDLSIAQRRRRRLVESQIRKDLEEAGDDETESIATLLAIPTDATPAPEPGQPDLNAAGDELWRISAQAAILSDIDLQVLTDELDAIATAELTGLRGKDAQRQPVDVEGVGHVVTGLIPIFLRTQQAVLESLIRSFGLAFVLIAFVMMILLRSVRAGLLTMLPNLMPVIVVFGLLSWGELRVDIGTMITASVALGIAVDGTLHLITWFQELIRRGETIPDAVAGALEHCGPAMWQTSAVVGLGMIALLPAELLLISRFGWMLAALIFAALIADIIFLPALLAGPLGTLIQRSVQRSQSADQASGAQQSGAGQRQEAAMSDLQSTASLFESLTRWWTRNRNPR